MRHPNRIVVMPAKAAASPAAPARAPFSWAWLTALVAAAAAGLQSAGA